MSPRPHSGLLPHSARAAHRVPGVDGAVAEEGEARLNRLLASVSPRRDPRWQTAPPHVDNSPCDVRPPSRRPSSSSGRKISGGNTGEEDAVARPGYLVGGSASDVGRPASAPYLTPRAERTHAGSWASGVTEASASDS